MQNIPPILESNDAVLIVVKEGNLFFIAVMKSENSPLLVVEFINQIIRLFKAYIGSVSEMKIRSNFSIVYQVVVSCSFDLQLLDEVSDFGIPVITEPSVMSALIQVPSVMNKVTNFVTKVAVGVL